MDTYTTTDGIRMMSEGCSLREFDGGKGGRRTCVLIHREEGKAVGYVMFSHTPDSPSVHVGWIAVEAEHRRRGIGSRLLQQVVDAASEQGAKEITLHVRVSNAGAMKFYRTLGFEVVGRMKDHYGDEDAWRMQLEVT